jgi:hypothetical protein
MPAPNNDDDDLRALCRKYSFKYAQVRRYLATGVLSSERVNGRLQLVLGPNIGLPPWETANYVTMPVPIHERTPTASDGTGFPGSSLKHFDTLNIQGDETASRGREGARSERSTRGQRDRLAFSHTPAPISALARPNPLSVADEAVGDGDGSEASGQDLCGSVRRARMVEVTS